MKRLILLLVVALPLGVFAQGKDPNMGIIPAPSFVNKGKGEFKFTPETMVLVDSPNHRAMRFFAEYLRKTELATGLTDLSRVDKKRMSVKNTITLSLDFKGDLPPEGYELRINEDNIELKARGAGMFYGIQTLLQIIHNTSPGYAT